MNFYINETLDFGSYRAMKKQIYTNRDFIRNELAKLSATIDEAGEPTITKEDIITNLRDNWENLSDPEKRQFLMRFIKKIVVLNEPMEGTLKGNTIITGVEFNER
ncbi:hypothetical protein M2150_001041 [Lachnospiraceae bacterium PM6-15]|uniref:hypothetical protein n=1 Tax=Ohessyouella blattaphilus TaxID=2949333 RepID=UPI003E2C75F2